MQKPSIVGTRNAVEFAGHAPGTLAITDWGIDHGQMIVLREVIAELPPEQRARAESYPLAEWPDEFQYAVPFVTANGRRITFANG